MARSSSGESLLERATRVLASFDEAHPALTLAELARRSHLPGSTAHRLASEMVKLGFLERGGDGRFRVGLTLWELATRASRATRLRDLALPYLDELQSVVKQHTLLGVLDGEEVLQIERLSARGATASAVHLAGRLPWYACSAGVMLVAHASPAEIEDLLRRERPAYTERTPVSRRALESALQEARRRGFSLAEGTTLEHATGAAAPILDGSGSPVAALWIVFPSEDPRRADLVRALVATATAITTALRGIGDVDGIPGLDPRFLSIHRNVARRALRDSADSGE